MDKSTIIYPIRFFESVLKDESNIQDVAESILYYSDYSSYKLEEHSAVVYGITVNEETGTVDEHIEYTENLIINLLKSEFQTSKDYLYQFCIKNNEVAIKSYLSIQVKAIQLLINKSKELLKYHPYFLTLLKNLVEYINKGLILPDMKEFDIMKQPASN